MNYVGILSHLILEIDMRWDKYGHS